MEDDKNHKFVFIGLLIFAVLAISFAVISIPEPKQIDDGTVQYSESAAIGTGIVNFKPSGGR